MAERKMRIIFAGTAEFAVRFLQVLHASEHEICAVYTQPDRPAGRGLKLHAGPVKHAAEQCQLPIYQPSSLQSDAVLAELNGFGADIMVDVAYGLLLPPDVLSAFPYGCINVHPSLLPRWRGAAPIERALLVGDVKTGVTIMQVDEGWDTGAILRQQAMPISIADTAEVLYRRLGEMGESLLLATLGDLQQNMVVPVKQDDAQSCYANKISKEEAKIAWGMSAKELDRMVRAFNPRPIAYTYLAKQLIRIWRAVALIGDNSVSPGTIVAANENGIDVVTGDGILRLVELQLSGGKVLTAQQLLNSKKELFRVGTKFNA